MIIEEHKPSVETGGPTSYEESFSIGNIGRIMTILRNSMYANPIKAIIREISCNARDAHREIGTPDRPIEIHLPNAFDDQFTIKDCGLGISPKRMSEVFIQYGVSTKNADNTQTGGFGLGAKTPFAYSDQFSIITTTKNDDGTKTKRSYIAYIDESSAGKMRLVAESPTEEETGTEIIITVNEYDYATFIASVLDVCQYWDTLPILKGNKIPEWPIQSKPIIEGNNWKLFPQQYGKYSLIIVDGVAYPINTCNIKLTGDFVSEKQNVLYKQFYLYIGNGEITLSANREELQYDDKTQKVINKYLDELIKTLSEQAVGRVNKAASYIEAVKAYRGYREHFDFALAKNFVPEWNGIKIFLRIPMKVGNRKNLNEVGYKITMFYYCQNRNGKQQLSSKDVSAINPDTKIILNDLSIDRISRSRVEHYLNENSLSHVNIITFTSLDMIGGLASMNTDAEIDISILNPILLSSIIAPKKVRTKRNAIVSGRAGARAFVYNSSYTTTHRKCDYYWEPTQVDMEQGEGIYVVSSGKSNQIASENTIYKNDNIRTIIQYLRTDDDEFNLYAIREADVPKLGPDWTPLKSFVDDKLNEDLLEKVSKEELREIFLQEPYMFDKFSTGYNECTTTLGTVFKKYPSTGVFNDYILMSLDIDKKIKEYRKLFELIKLIEPNFWPANAPVDVPLLNLMDKVKKTYPLITKINWWGINPKELAEYIFLIDKENLSLDKARPDAYIKAVNE
jgi:hypothetical protein